MGKGIWYNPRTEQIVDVACDNSYTHNEWIVRPKNAEWIGLSSSAQALIAQATDIDEIRKAAVRDGLVRAREYKNYVSVTLSVVGEDHDLLHKVARVISAQYGRFSYLRLHNIATEKVVHIHLPDLQEKLDAGNPIDLNGNMG